MNWDNLIKSYQTYLVLEKKLSSNSISAYLYDLYKFTDFLKSNNYNASPEEIGREHFGAYFQNLMEMNVNARAQVRIICSIRGFYKYLIVSGISTYNPTQFITSPKYTRTLPDVLNISEINNIIAAIDTDCYSGIRNRAILETLYSCGLRIWELLNLKVSNLHFDEKYIKILGKGNIERVVPIGANAIQYINDYKDTVREEPKEKHKDILFLNGRGARLTKQTMLAHVKKIAAKAGVNKRVGHHTFRHSFATHLMEAGADIRAIQGLLGHKSIVSTEIYTHLDVEHLKKTVTMYHPRG